MSIRNEPAFPGEKNVRFGQPNDCNEGLTKREYFAAMAMQGMAMRTRGLLDHEVARASVALADALIAELERMG